MRMGALCSEQESDVIDLHINIHATVLGTD